MKIIETGLPTSPRVKNAWVLVLVLALWILSIVLYVPGMP